MIKPNAFIHPLALVDEGAEIGSGSRIWAYAHILPGAVVGADCNVCDHTFIEGSVVVGDRVTIKSGVYLWNGLIVRDDVFIGPCAAFTNDLRPRSKKYPVEFPNTILDQGCTIGANATILPGVIIGKSAMVGAGAVVTRSVPDHVLVIGNPAHFVGWVCRCGEKLAIERDSSGLCNSCGCCFFLRGTRLEINM